MKTRLEDIARQKYFSEGSAEVDDAEDERGDTHGTKAVEGHAGPGFIEGIDNVSTTFALHPCLDMSNSLKQSGTSATITTANKRRQLQATFDVTLGSYNRVNLEGFDFDAFLKDIPAYVDKSTDVSEALVPSVAPPTDSQINEVDTKTKQGTGEDKVSR